MAVVTDQQRRGVAVLGSTGSVGQSTMSVLDALSDQFRVVALAAGSNIDRLQAQIDRFQPDFASVADASRAGHLRGVTVVDSPDPLRKLAVLDDVDIVVIATTGHAAIQATIDALNAGKVVALANKEAIVAAGEIVMDAAHRGSGELRPVDSEHSAIWQCLQGAPAHSGGLTRIILTASGGPFRGYTRQQLRAVTAQQALQHPTWSMGAKITIDSATLMNKGFELIEAMWLFSCPLDRIDVVIHPQSIVHSMVEFDDGALIAQLGSHDMRNPIQYALTYPKRLPGPGDRLSWEDMSRLDFEAPDLEAFPALNLSRAAANAGSTYPAVLSAADEVAVEAFLAGRIGFLESLELVERVLDEHVAQPGGLTLEAVSEAERWATERAWDHAGGR